MSDHTDSSAAADTCSLLYRSADALTVALRSDQPLSLEELVQLNRSASCADDTMSSLGSRTTSVFSSRIESSVTKPTSAGTSYVVDDKVIATYASSISATHGSASEAETDHDTAFFGIGHQFNSESTPLSGLGKHSRTKKSKAKCKKPVLVIHHEHPLQPSSDEEALAIINQGSRRNGKESKYVRYRPRKRFDEAPVLPENTRRESAFHDPPTHSRLIIGLCVLIALTLVFSAVAAHHTGKEHLARTKVIIYLATVLVSVCTVLAMSLARRALQEALLAGLLEGIIGFVLVFQIHEFMGQHVA